MNRKVLVTGGTGFVGRRLVQILIERGFDVSCLVRPNSDVSELKAWRVRLVTGDLSDAKSLEGVAAGMEVVFHTACSVQHTFAHAGDSLQRFREVNVNGSANLAREALAAEVKRFVHVSSTAAMGTPEEVEVDETTKCRPTAPYQVSKYEAEQTMLQLHRDKGLPVVIVRSCLVLGPGRDKAEVRDMFRLVQRRLFPILGFKTSQRKPLIYIDDLANALILAAECGRAGEIYLVTSGRPYTLKELVSSLEKVVGRWIGHIHVPYLPLLAAATVFELMGKLSSWTPPVNRARVKLFRADRAIKIDKAIRELGYQPRFTDLEDMLRRTYEWYRAEGIL